MTAIAKSCLLCGAPLERRHHPTGSSGGRYWDVRFIVEVCHDCHELLHDDWFSAGASDKWQPPTVLHMLEVSFRRVGMLFGRLAAQGLWVELTEPVAAWLATAAERLRQVIAAFDVGVPGWRDLPDVQWP